MLPIDSGMFCFVFVLFLIGFGPLSLPTTLVALLLLVLINGSLVARET